MDASTAQTLQIGDNVVAHYETGGDLASEDSRRPYLHPVTTLAGTSVTAFRPDDHRHHLGVSLAVPDVNGTTFWGGRTFVRDQGSTLLDNHGQQVRVALEMAADGFIEQLDWVDRRGARLLSERREITAGQTRDGLAWTLDWTSELEAGASAVRFASPAVNGRPGAGYGGLFWRFPSNPGETVFTTTGPGATFAHGQATPWLAVRSASEDSASTVILVQGVDPLPWFVRDVGYVGAGPALAFDEPLILPAGQTMTCGVTAVITDTWLETPQAVEELLSVNGVG